MINTARSAIDGPNVKPGVDSDTSVNVVVKASGCTDLNTRHSVASPLDANATRFSALRQHTLGSSSSIITTRHASPALRKQMR